jgi:hypothetical protein
MLPKTISALAEDNAALLYNLLFTAASQALLCVGRTWSLLQAETGFIGVLHTWSQLVCCMPICMCCGSAALDDAG